MSLFDLLPRRAASIEDPRTVRLLESFGDDLTPRPEFRERLRESVLDLHRTAGGTRSPARLRPIRLVARAVLVACVALAATVGSVLGASQAAVPGDLLYPVKLEVEALRLRVAPPDVQPALARAMFAERIDELGTLVDRGEWDLASAMAAPIDGALSRMRALDVDPADADRGLATQLSRLATLLPTLPANGASAVTEALGDAADLLGAHPDEDGEPPAGNGQGTNNGNGGGSENGNTGNGQGTNNGNGQGTNNGNGNGNGDDGGSENGNTGNGQGTNNGNGNGDDGGSENGNTGNGQGTSNGNGGGSGNGSENGNTGNGQGTNSGNGNGSENGNTGNGQGTNNGNGNGSENGNGPKASASPSP